MSEMNCQECKMELHGYLDNELEAGEALKLHKHLAGCKACQNQYRQMRKMMQLVREKAPYYEMPVALTEKILAAVGAQRTSGNANFIAGWIEAMRDWHIAVLAPAASFAALALAIFLYTAVPAADDRLTDEAVSGHVRSLMAQHLTDVASSDRHTVKPWFIGKLDFTPPVFDFAPQGFSLVGGRMDYLQSQTVAALVYQHKKHFINLFVAPVAQADSGKMDRLTKRGYNLVEWRKNHMRFIAVSDMGMEDLAAFAQLFQGSLAR